MSKKYPFDLASMMFGKNGLLGFLSGLKKVKTELAEISKQTQLGLPASKTPLTLPAPQTGLTTTGSTDLTPTNGGPTSVVPVPTMPEEEKTNFFANMIKNARMAASNIWQLFMNLLNKLRTAASDIFTSAFTAIKSKAIKFTNSIKAQYYKATNQAFMTDENGRVTKASVEDTRMTVYDGKTANSEASKFSRMWQDHVNRVRDSVNRVKEDFTTIWQHHNERVNESVRYASAQFNKLKASASNVFGQISNITANVADGIKSRYGKAVDFMRAKTLSIRNAFVKMTSKGKPTYTDEAGKVRRTEVLPATYESDGQNTQQTYSNVKSSASRVAAEVSRIWQQHIVNLRGSFTAVKNDVSTIWQHHKARVADSVTYTKSQFAKMTGSISAQFNKFRSVTSKVFSKISTVAKTASVAVKGFFGNKIISPIVNKFNNMANKIKVDFNKIKATASATANATAAAFKSKLGYNQDTTQATPSMFDALTKVQDQKLFIGNETEVAGILDTVNKKTAEGQVALQKYISTMGDGNDAVKAYVASLNGEKATMSGFNAFIQQHNAGVKASGIAAKAAAVGHTLLNAALSMGLSVLIQFAMQGLQWLIDKTKDSIFVTQALEEELETLQSDISDLNSEIDSLNSELETCNDRIAELLAMPSLSFTEQEELQNLQLQNAELERQIELNKLLLKSKEKEHTDKAKEWVNNVWNGEGVDKKYWVSGNGTIKEDMWWQPGVSGKEALETSLPKYEKLQQETSDMEDLYLSAQKQLDENGKLSTDIRKSIIDSANIKYPKAKSDEQIISALDNTVNNNKDTLGRMETGINMVLGDMANAISEYELSYSIGDKDINEFLDGYYAYSDAWNVAQGVSAKSDVISNMFSSIASEEVQKLGESLREITNNENLSLDEQKSKIEGVINNLDKENDAYNTLRTTMETVGVTAQDIADYFVLKTGAFDSNTIEGITAQYQKGIEVLKQGENFSYQYIDANNETKTIKWADLFDWDEATKEATANADAISKVLKGADEKTREQFSHLVEGVAEGKLDFEQAIKSFGLSGSLRGFELVEEQISAINADVFKGLGDEISGVIDTFSEFGAALEDVANSMEILHTAQTQMNNSNRISVKTALDLINSTDQWNEILKIENGNIQLLDNAEEVLIQTKLDHIKVNLQAALSTVKAQLAQIAATGSAQELATTLEESTNMAVVSLAENMAYLSGLVEAFANGNWGGAVKAAEEARSAVTIKTTSYRSGNSLSQSELERKQRDIEAQLAMLEGIDTTDEFKNYYDYEKKPGDKYEDKDSDKDKKTAKDLFDELAAEYDRKISTLEYKKDLIQSEIDKAEARGEVASEAFYQRQIELEEKNRQALINKKKALEDYLKTQGKNMTKEEWADAQEEINDTALAIEECEKNVIDLGQAIEDIHWEYFDKFTSDVDDLGDENSTLLSLVGDTDDAVDENGNWTASGVTQIGLNAQEMQRNLEMADRMQKEKDNIQKSWDEYQRVLAKHGGDASKVTEEEKKKIRDKYDGVLITSEGEYQERMQDVTKRQRDYAKAAKDSKDAIEDLAKARVDKEIEAIEEEIDAYKELISLKKEELQSERD